MPPRAFHVPSPPRASAVASPCRRMPSLPFCAHVLPCAHPAAPRARASACRSAYSLALYPLARVFKVAFFVQQTPRSRYRDRNPHRNTGYVATFTREKRAGLRSKTSLTDHSRELVSTWQSLLHENGQCVNRGFLTTQLWSRAVPRTQLRSRAQPERNSGIEPPPERSPAPNSITPAPLRKRSHKRARPWSYARVPALARPLPYTVPR